MKKFGLLFVLAAMISTTGWSQELAEFDYIAPFNDGMAAVKKGEQWGFINDEGQQVIDLRDDLVLINYKSKSYPIFSDGRCLITEVRDGIKYFGYIDKSGKVVYTEQVPEITHEPDYDAALLALSQLTG